jgi:metalloendopeptidase OMA1, mitochondrial
MRLHVAWMLPAMILAAGCAKEHVVHPPLPIGVVTEPGPPSSQQANAVADALTDDAALVGPVMRVSSRLIAAARQSAYAPRAQGMCWRIAVYADPGMRAFIRSDGLIIVYAGTFRLAETEAGLAALLGHELAHALAGDAAPLSPPCLGANDQPPSLPMYEDELRADGAGLDLMADAGYDPRELLGLWHRMRIGQRERDKVVEHVTYDRRMEQIGQRLPEAIMRYERTNRAPQKRLPSRELR